MSYWIKILVINLLVLLLTASTAFASQLDDQRAKLENINAQIEATKAKRDDAKKRQEKVLQQIQLSDQRMIQAQIKLNNMQTELNNTISRRKDAEAKLSETQRRLVVAQKNLAAAKEKLELRRKAFSKRLISIYKNDKLSSIMILLSSKDIGDLIKRVLFVGMIADNDGRLVHDMKRLTNDITIEIEQTKIEEKAIDQQRLNLITEENRISTIKNDIIAEQKQLQDEVDKQRQLYAQIQQEEDHLAQTEGLLKASSNRVAAQIRALGERGGARQASSIPGDLRTLAAKTASDYGIPTKLFFALIKQESGWNHRAVSHAGAIGLTQVMPFNVIAMGYSIKSFRNSPSDQLEAGASYLSTQYKTFDRWDLALAAYNAGPGAVMMYGGIPPYRETRNYVRSILRMAGM